MDDTKKSSWDSFLEAHSNHKTTDYLNEIVELFRKQQEEQHDKFVRTLILPRTAWRNLMWKGVNVSDKNKKEQLMGTIYTNNDFEIRESVKCANCGGTLGIRHNYYYNHQRNENWCFNCYEEHSTATRGTYTRIIKKHHDDDAYCLIQECFNEQEYLVNLIIDEKWVIRARACEIHVYDMELFGNEISN